MYIETGPERTFLLFILHRPLFRDHLSKKTHFIGRKDWSLKTDL